jgi:small subunit ribosomal protein S16
MAVKIRLMRVGKTKQPTYRIVVADSRSARDGRILETIGHYGPRQTPSAVDINGDRALAWLREGAQPTEQVQKLLTITGVWATFESEKSGPIVTKLNRRGFRTGKVPVPTKQAKPAAAPVPEAPAPAPAAAVVDEAPGDDTPDATPAEAPAAEVTTPEATAEAAAPEVTVPEVTADAAAPEDGA